MWENPHTELWSFALEMCFLSLFLKVALQTRTVLYGFNHCDVQTPSERRGLSTAL